MRFLFLMLFVSVPFYGSAQKKVSVEESQKMIKQVCTTASKITSLQCDFRQDKRLSLLETVMTSRGKMYYKDGKLLRWEYTSPYTYVFILNNDEVMLKSSRKTDVISVKSSKVFQQIVRILMNSITGECLSNTEDFKVVMYVNAGKWMAQLVPQQKELAQLFTCVRLYIDPSIQMVTVVELVEKSGDTTRIEMENVKKNEAVNDVLFKIK